jgi:hypothetical protein
LPNIVGTPRPGEEEIEQTDDVIHAQSSSETELDNLPTFDIERSLSKLRSNSTDDSTEDVGEIVSSGRRSSAKLGDLVSDYIPHSFSDPDEIPSSPSPKSSFLLIPLRRNPQSGPKDIIPSPRRPKTAADSDEFLLKFRTESWDNLEEPPNTASTARSRGASVTEGEGAHQLRLRQSTGSLSARLHPLQFRKQENDTSLPSSTCSSPSAGLHSKSHSHRKSVTSSWTEQLEESKEVLDTVFGESGKHTSKLLDQSRSTFQTNSDSLAVQGSSRSKHSQLHLAGSSSLKPHSPSVTVTPSPSQPSTPPTTLRKKMPTQTSSGGSSQRFSFTNSSTTDRSSTPSVTGQNPTILSGSSYPSSNFLSSTGKQNSLRGSARFTKPSVELSVSLDTTLSKSTRQNGRPVDQENW